MVYTTAIAWDLDVVGGRELSVDHTSFKVTGIHHLGGSLVHLLVAGTAMPATTRFRRAAVT